MTWRDVAEHFGEGVSHATLRRIANGHEPSAATCRAMGVRKTDRYRLHYECGRGAAGRKRDRGLRDEMAAAGVGSFTEYVDWLREQEGK